MKLLILGHGRHGKDTVAEMIAKRTGMRHTSSSLFAAEKVVFKTMAHQYDTPAACYEDRHNHRQEWYELIKDYNTPDKSRLCRELLRDYDIYVGMRDSEEYEACMGDMLFDYVLWVDRHMFRGDDLTMKILFDPVEMVYIDNNGGLERLSNNVDRFLSCSGLL